MLLALMALSISSCRVERFLKDDEMVLYKNKYTVAMADSSKVTKEVKEALSSKKKYARQKPNSKVLGIDPIRFKLWLYTISSPKKDNRINRWFRKKGQPPVVYSENDAKLTAMQLEGLMETKGCFKSQVTFDTLKIKKRNITIQYNIKASPRFHIEQALFISEDTALNGLMEKWAADSYVKSGEMYDRDNLVKERTRLYENLLNEGYYTASKELISFVVDTTDYGNHGLTVTTHLHRPQSHDGEKSNLKVHKIDNIYIYPQASASDVGLDTAVYHYKTKHFTTDYTFIHPAGKMEIRHGTISRALTLFHNQRYRPRSTTNSYNSLLSLRNFKYIDIKYNESPNSSEDNKLLDATVRLMRSDQRRFSVALELNNASSLGTKENRNFFTSGNFGIETTLSYQNKNLFGGAEILKVEGSLLLELPKLVFTNRSLKFRDAFSAFEAGLNISLDIPNFLLPGTRNIVWQRMRPHTVFTIAGSYQYRPYYERFPANTSLAYTWTHSRRARNQMVPIELTFVKFFNLDPALVSRLNALSDLRLKYQYSDHFIMDARYDYVYSTQIIGSRQNFHYVHLTAETAGNLLHGLSLAFNGPIDENGIRRVWGVPYSQYARASIEYKNYLYWGKKSTFVSRIMLGIGIPYANSSMMPYEKAFFGGGPTTMRAWQLRRLGPGCYNGNDGGMLEKMGDMTLVINLEQRFPIAWILEGAIFADIGNVWLIHKSEEFPDGEFRFNNMFRSMAMGAGIGIRANISILTLRLDFGLPLYDPGYNKEYRWRPEHWNFNQIVTNFGIDYPF